MNKPGDIILIRSSYTPAGGIERVAASLLQGLLQRGARVTLLTLPGQKWPVSHANLRIVAAGLAHGHRLIQAWAFNRSVNRYLAENKADCVLALDKVTRFTHLHAGGGTHMTFLKMKDRYDPLPARLLRRFSLYHRYILHLERKGFANPDLRKVRCNSRLVMHDIRKDYAVDFEKLVLVPSGIRWKEMQTCFDQRARYGSELCRQHHLDPQLRYLLFLGSGFTHKGMDIVIRGLKHLPADYHLVVVGKGSAVKFRRKAAALNIGDRLHFLGARTNGWQYAAMCKAVVLPSYYDPFGGAAAEGNAMGLPVLVSDRTGYADWVVEGSNGIILKTPTGEAGITDAFERLQHVIEQPVWSADRIRQQARHLDDELILERLLEGFFR